MVRVRLKGYIQGHLHHGLDTFMLFLFLNVFLAIVVFYSITGDCEVARHMLQLHITLSTNAPNGRAKEAKIKYTFVGR